MFSEEIKWKTFTNARHIVTIVYFSEISQLPLGFDTSYLPWFQNVLPNNIRSLNL
jgi:hypothetical protein